MAKWNVSSDAMTLEQQPRRSPSSWLRQNGLRIAILVGVIEGIYAWHTGHKFLMLLIGVLSVAAYWSVRHRLPTAIRRPLWIIVTAQAVAGILVPFITLGIFVLTIGLVCVLLVLVFVMLSDRGR
jgi:hypothetical protein